MYDKSNYEQYFTISIGMHNKYVSHNEKYVSRPVVKLVVLNGLFKFKSLTIIRT
jgi:hypothetical protein